MSERRPIDELDIFFRSSATNAERVPPNLKELLSVKTVLQDVATRALAEGKTVIVAGTAGSGKTHLLGDLEGAGSFKVVPDLSTVQSEWPTLFLGGQALVAGNEGAFLLGAKEGYPKFQEIVDTLHRIQLGEEVVSGELVVIDAAAYDPVSDGVVGGLVSNPLVQDYIEARGEPMRAAAWELLSSELVQQRLNRILEIASAAAGPEGFTFRQLWQFVADLSRNGHDYQSLWFWRLFFGNSGVAQRVQHSISPAQFALPHTAARLWYGDLLGLKSKFLPEAEKILKMLLPNTEGRPFELFRLLAAFGLQESPLDTFAERRADTWGKICHSSDVRRLLRHINQYLDYGLLQLQQDDHLHLWVQTDTERRETKPRVQISLGLVGADKFKIRKNRIAANSDDIGKELTGRRVMLVLDGTNTTLEVTKDLIDGIDHVRSHRLLDRKDVEFDWRLLNFLSAVAKHQTNTRTLHVGHFDFRSRSGQLSIWDVSDGMVVKKMSGPIEIARIGNPWLTGKFVERIVPLYVLHNFLAPNFETAIRMDALKVAVVDSSASFGEFAEVTRIPESEASIFGDAVSGLLSADRRVFRDLKHGGASKEGSLFPAVAGLVKRASDDGLGSRMRELFDRLDTDWQSRLSEMLAPQTVHDPATQFVINLLGSDWGTVKSTPPEQAGLSASDQRLAQFIDRLIRPSATGSRIFALRELALGLYLCAIVKMVRGPIDEFGMGNSLVFVFAGLPPGDQRDARVAAASQSYQSWLSRSWRSTHAILTQKLASEPDTGSQGVAESRRARLIGLASKHALNKAPDVVKTIESILAESPEDEAAFCRLVLESAAVGLTKSELMRRFRSLGSNIGVAGPDRGIGRPRLFLDTPILSVLTRGLVTNGRMDFEDFITALAETFGFVVGPGRNPNVIDDLDLIGSQGADPFEIAVTNQELLRERLLRVGLARSYSDSHTEVVVND